MTEQTISKEERHIIEHSLGWLEREPLYRNRFVTDPACAQGLVIAGLVDRGLMCVGAKPSPLTGGNTLFCVTREGILLLASLPDQPKRTKTAAKELALKLEGMRIQ